VGYGEVHLPEMQMHTTSFWVTFPEAIVRAQPAPRPEVLDALRGLANAMHIVATVGLMVDPRDLGRSLGYRKDPDEPPGKGSFDGPGFDPTIFLYDYVAGGIGPYSSVLKIGETYHLWYHAMDTVQWHTGKDRGCICYARSRDGIRWEKPELGLIPFQGSKANNIVAPLDEQQSMQGATVFIDHRAPVEARYRLWTKYRPTDAEVKAGTRPGLWAMHSPDGIHWTYDANQPNPVDQMCDTQNIFFYDEDHGCYVGFDVYHCIVCLYSESD